MALDIGRGGRRSYPLHLWPSSADPRWPALQAWMLLAIGAWHANPEAVSAVQTYALPRSFHDGLLDALVHYGTSTL